MDEATRQQARDILQACRRARAYLHGDGPAKKRARAAALCFSPYTKDGVLSPHVRDVYNAQGVRSVELALSTLEELAEAFAKAE